MHEQVHRDHALLPFGARQYRSMNALTRLAPDGGSDARCSRAFGSSVFGPAVIDGLRTGGAGSTVSATYEQGVNVAVVVNTGGANKPTTFADAKTFNVSNDGVLYVNDLHGNYVAVYAPGNWVSAAVEGAASGGERKASPAPRRVR